MNVLIDWGTDNQIITRDWNWRVPLLVYIHSLIWKKTTSFTQSDSKSAGNQEDLEGVEFTKTKRGDIV